MRRGARWFDRFVHPPTLAAGGDELRRSRTAIRILLFIIVAVPLGITGAALLGKLEFAARLLGAWSFAATLLVAVRLGIRVTWLGYALGVVMLPIAASAARVSGGLHSQPVLGMMMLPSLTVFISGGRAGWIFAPCVIGIYAWLSLNTSGELVPVRERLLGTTAVMLVMTGASIAFENQRKRAERERDRAYKEVEATREAVELALGRAERASAAKGEFLANMSHDDQERETAYPPANFRHYVLLNMH